MSHPILFLALLVPPTPEELIRIALPLLVKMQEEEGQWPYEGVYRVEGEIPVGYRVGGTAIVATTLLQAATPQDADAAAAITKGLEFVLKGLEHPLMEPSTENRYDVRVWGHAYALEFFCRLREAKREGKRAADVKRWIPKLIETLVKEELPEGGWNYAHRMQPASFVTAPVVQALLLARSQGEKVPAKVLERARASLEAARRDSGAFFYGGKEENDRKALLPGSIARSPVCEATLLLLGGGSAKALQASLDAFHEHWGELEKRRKKTGTHVGPYLIAPYYFYYGHYYAAQAIELLPEAAREKERARLLEVILRTRDEDGTWNDRVFPRSRNYGTAMIVRALLGPKLPLPPRLAQMPPPPGSGAGSRRHRRAPRPPPSARGSRPSGSTGPPSCSRGPRAPR